MLVDEPFRISADIAYSAKKNLLVGDLGVRAQQPDLGEGQWRRLIMEARWWY